MGKRDSWPNTRSCIPAVTGERVLIPGYLLSGTNNNNTTSSRICVLYINAENKRFFFLLSMFFLPLFLVFTCRRQIDCIRLLKIIYFSSYIIIPIHKRRWTFPVLAGIGVFFFFFSNAILQNKATTYKGRVGKYNGNGCEEIIKVYFTTILFLYIYFFDFTKK